SGSMLFNINSRELDDDRLAALDIPRSMLPEVRASSEIYGHTKTTVFASKLPLAGIAGDQQAALFGQMCTSSGMVKNTYATGCFLMMNTGDKPIESRNNLVPTFAGLGAPHWNARARGSLFGVTRGTSDAHLARAALDSIAYQSLDVLAAMEADSGISIGELRVDGGASANNLLMQFQADLLGVD
ncbi:FGGY-family carbohydrate kinase, partial [Paraburkholderia phenoliruptrix]|uniref:FGGY-family carbohydrate kinase n=1 Tax=Paraburkholderia phenoliruptrix TaxID=252970 RepID=UPI001FC8E749